MREGGKIYDGGSPSYIPYFGGWQLTVNKVMMKEGLQAPTGNSTRKKKATDCPLESLPQQEGRD